MRQPIRHASSTSNTQSRSRFRALRMAKVSPRQKPCRAGSLQMATCVPPMPTVQSCGSSESNCLNRARSRSSHFSGYLGVDHVSDALPLATVPVLCRMLANPLFFDICLPPTAANDCTLNARLQPARDVSSARREQSGIIRFPRRLSRHGGRLPKVQLGGSPQSACPYLRSS